MKMLLVALILVSGSAFAAKSYDLKLDYMVNGKRVASPAMVVKEGVTSTVFSETATGKSFIEVTPTKDMEDNKLKMKFIVGTIDEMGERTVLARPEMMIEENRMGKISTGENEGTEDMTLSAFAKEKIEK